MDCYSMLGFAYDRDGKRAGQECVDREPDRTSSTAFAYGNSDLNTQATSTLARSCTGAETLTQSFAGAGGAEVAGLGASALVVVEGDVAGDPGSEFVDGGEGVPVEVLVFEDRPEALGAGVVVAAAGGAHGADQAGCRAGLDDLAVAELAA